MDLVLSGLAVEFGDDVSNSGQAHSSALVQGCCSGLSSVGDVPQEERDRGRRRATALSGMAWDSLGSSCDGPVSTADHGLATSPHRPRLFADNERARFPPGARPTFPFHNTYRSVLDLVKGLDDHNPSSS